ncbi:MAG: beta-ketoacyl-[acyl-carrier-protein] synthase family protein [Desulfobacteraceae bacterium]|nr:MAG: beta-ketoacyl-[acyl-carrier-protein] synthase family protein [Desulfobacteraceae bacterium]
MKGKRREVAMRIIISGMGIVSAIGMDVPAYWNNLVSGKSGLRPITLFDTSKYRCKLGYEVVDLDPQQLGITKGVNTYDRIQLFTSGAAKLAWGDAGLHAGYYSSEDMGVVLGSTYGYIDSVSRFYMESLRYSPAYVSPIAFANTVMNAPAGRIAINFKIKGLCSTIATGESSGLDAIGYACDFIRTGRCRTILVGAGSVLCEGTFMGFYYTRLLSGSKDKERELCSPFDKNGNGLILGEGAAMLVLEGLEQARLRGAPILAEVKGLGSQFACNQKDPEDIIQSHAASMQEAIASSNIGLKDISLIIANANSDPRTDNLEAQAIKRVFGDKAKEITTTAIKSATGECLDASALMQTLAGVCAIRDGKVPPIVNLKEPIESDRIRYAYEAYERPIDAVLINAFSHYGKSTSMVISACNE